VRGNRRARRENEGPQVSTANGTKFEYGGVDLALDRSSMIRQAHTCSRRHDAAHGANEQSDPERFFQLLDLCRHCRLREVQTLCRAGNTTRLDDDQECRKQCRIECTYRHTISIADGTSKLMISWGNITAADCRVWPRPPKPRIRR
jgi:hypothetical protein